MAGHYCGLRLQHRLQNALCTTYMPIKPPSLINLVRRPKNSKH
uniref:Uncharacterized protein n=1 Tax=Parascaris univalens TaxID=6257 RepID=A0A914ZK69_PARUN